MRHFVYISLLVTMPMVSSGLFAAKKKKPSVAEQPVTVVASQSSAVPSMTADQKVLHSLSRLTFGARPGEFEQVKEMGITRWIDLQMHPERIAENPRLEAKLLPLDTLRMSPLEMAAKYPTQQQVKAIADGRQPMPANQATRYMIERAVARHQGKEGAARTTADVQAEPAKLLEFLLPRDQQQILQFGKPPEQAKLIGELPETTQWDVLGAMPQGARQRLYPAALPSVRRKILMFNGPQQVVNQDLTEGKLLRAVYSNRQLEEVLTDFWFNHFNVYLDKGADRYFVTSYERDAIRPHVLGHFKDLLLATAQSPAMLFYLDNFQSVSPNLAVRAGAKRAAGLNENYGRELMELHTLGVDSGYTQQDVTEVARCFTGWTIRQPQRGGGFEFNPRIHDSGEKRVLGHTIPAGGGMDDGLTVLDILDHHPSTALFISRSLAIRFVSDNPPDELVRKMATTFQSTDGDLREVMRTMLNAPEFWNPGLFRSKVKSPLEMLVSSIRAVDGDVDYAFSVAGQLNQLGEPLYRKAEPTGYSNKSGEWMNSAALLARMNFAVALAQNQIPGVKVDSTQFRGDHAQIERGILSSAASADAQAAIEAGVEQQMQQRSQNSFSQPDAPVTERVRMGNGKGQRSGFQIPEHRNNQPFDPNALVAGLTLGSPDFQRR